MAYDQVLIQACSMLEIEHELRDATSGMERDIERLRVEAELERVARYAWDRIERARVTGRTVTLKVKFQDFTLITRSKSFACPIGGFEDFLAAGKALLGQLHPVPRGIRLLGLGLHNLSGEDSPVPAQLGLAI